jgi:hypothetical protein
MSPTDAKDRSLLPVVIFVPATENVIVALAVLAANTIANVATTETINRIIFS